MCPRLWSCRISVFAAVGTPCQRAISIRSTKLGVQKLPSLWEGVALSAETRQVMRSAERYRRSRFFREDFVKVTPWKAGLVGCSYLLWEARCGLCDTVAQRMLVVVTHPRPLRSQPSKALERWYYRHAPQIIRISA
jgi:hypothetical protein